MALWGSYAWNKELRAFVSGPSLARPAMEATRPEPGAGQFLCKAVSKCSKHRDVKCSAYCTSMYLAKEKWELLRVPHNSAVSWTLLICFLLPRLRSIEGAVIDRFPSLGHQSSQSSWPQLLTLLSSHPWSSTSESLNPGRTAGPIHLPSCFPISPKHKTTNLLQCFFALCQPCPAGYQVLLILPAPSFWHLLYDSHTISIAFDQPVSMSQSTLWLSVIFTLEVFPSYFVFTEHIWRHRFLTTPPIKQRSDIFSAWPLRFTLTIHTLPFGLFCPLHTPS